MRTDYEQFGEGQVWMMKNGLFILITGVDPKSSIKNNDKTRIVHVKTGVPHTKMNFEDGKFILESEADAASVEFSINPDKTYSIHELRRLVAHFCGTLNDSGNKIYSRAFSDMGY